MSKDSETPLANTTSTDPPPPYTPSPAAQASAPNPGFCPLAFSERHANRTPGGGLTPAQYFEPCAFCGIIIGDEIPGSYKDGWQKTWVDPSINFRWESHIPAPKEKEMVERRKVEQTEEKADEKVEDYKTIQGANQERLSCWLCWEYEEKWVESMVPEEWYIHLRGHFRDEGYIVCKGKTGGMQRRRNCMVKHCPKIHS